MQSEDPDIITKEESLLDDDDDDVTFDAEFSYFGDRYGMWRK